MITRIIEDFASAIKKQEELVCEAQKDLGKLYIDLSTKSTVQNSDFISLMTKARKLGQVEQDLHILYITKEALKKDTPDTPPPSNVTKIY